MANEQAIDILNAVKFIIEDYTDEMEEAFSMAISALKAQQAAGDTISRCELFNRLANVQTIADAYAVIQGMPASQQKPEWAQKVEEYRKSAPSFVRKPLVWALYQTWKEYDERLFNKNRSDAADPERSEPLWI